jgi:hypothetical protein
MNSQSEQQLRRKRLKSKLFTSAPIPSREIKIFCYSHKFYSEQVIRDARAARVKTRP